jgi:N-carbamoyl-L-amino-acid hydrolase
VSVGDELKRIGYAGPRAHRPSVGAYFEAHIEQGPVLEDQRTTIGVVQGCLGQKWFDLKLTGVEAHAGPTPMHLRKDALVGAAEWWLRSTAWPTATSPCLRHGLPDLHPGSRNVIPGQVR